RCSVADCTKKAQSRRLCIAHGGGTRCQSQNCMKLAQSQGLCAAHGGGRRCAMEKFRQIRNLCKAHANESILSDAATLLSWSSKLKPASKYSYGFPIIPGEPSDHPNTLHSLRRRPI
ncbi:hypothetical protein PHMEG_00034864, partial [Phytophthora megakarya]